MTPRGMVCEICGQRAPPPDAGLVRPTGRTGERRQRAHGRTTEACMYHSDAGINDAVLTIVNDGNGKQCGMDYAARVRAGRDGGRIMPFMDAVLRYKREFTRSEEGLRRAATAARILVDYYVAHARECAPAEGVQS